MATEPIGPEDMGLPVGPAVDELPAPDTPPEPPDEEAIKKAAQTLVKDYELDDRPVHELISRECRKFELYWQNIQDIIWDTTNRDWVSASGVLQSTHDIDIDPTILDKTIGIYRSYGEIVAAALSQTTPIVRFPPNDADSGADLTTARTSDAIAELIAKHNDAQLLFLRALYTKFNQHFVAAFHCVVTDEQFGTVERPVIGMEENTFATGETVCPMCGAPMMGDMCTLCNFQGMGEPEQMTEQVPVVKEVLTEPKGRIRIEVWGPRNVKVQPYCKDITASPYLILETDLHENLIKELYPEFKSEMSTDMGDIRRVDRRPVIDFIDTRKIHTLKRCWLRPWAFNGVKDEDILAHLKTTYKKGLFIVICEDQVLEMTEENLDEHWDFVVDPFSEYIHGDPRGKFLLPLQDMTNDCEMLALETILHNIPEMYADPKVVNFKTYGEKEAKPGQLNQATAPEGQALASGFFQPQGATLSKEVDNFLQRLQELAQFVIGAPPSIFGGAQQGGSGTLGEYQQSRAQAQQRLGTDWKMLNKWWAKVMDKCVTEYRAFMKQLAQKVQDPAYAESFVKKTGENYVNVWIRLEDMVGATGEAEPETSDQFPVSWEQQRGLLFEILQNPNPTMQGLVSNPENIGTVRDILGMYKLKIPGEQDHDKQLFEIQQMLGGQPQMIEQFIDNHQIHWITTSSWANSPTGRDAKITNPQGYQLVLQHAMQHYLAMQAMVPPAAGGAAPDSGAGPAEDQGSSQPPDTGGAKGEPPKE